MLRKEPGKGLERWNRQGNSAFYGELGALEKIEPHSAPERPASELECDTFTERDDHSMHFDRER